MVQTRERETTKWRAQSRVHLALGIIGLTAAAVLIFPKATRLIDGDLTVLGRGAIANLALVFGSLMFLRNSRQFRTRGSAESREPRAESQESRVPSRIEES